MHKYFDSNRFLLLLKNDIFINRTTILVVTITIISILLLTNLVSPYNIYSINQHPTGFFALLYIGGIWITSMSFKELHNKEKSYLFLMLPSSHFEKLLNKILLTAIIYPIAILILYSLFYWLIAGLAKLTYNFTPTLFNPLQPHIWHAIYVYIFVSSIFFLGSIYFKSHTIIKTILCLAIFGIVLSIITAIIGIFFVNSFSIMKGVFFLATPKPTFFSTYHALSNVIATIIRTLLPILCWYISYWRLKEAEV